MSAGTLTLILLATSTYTLKAAGPVLFGGERSLPEALNQLAQLLPAPLLAALVAISAFVTDSSLTIDAKVFGLLAAAVALWKNAPFVVVVAVAAATTAAVRAFFGG